MPVYEYIALDADGTRHQGLVEDDNPAAVRKRLRELGRYPVELHEAGQMPSRGGHGSWLGLLAARVRPGAMAAVTRQLATLLDAGMPLVPALSLLVEQCETPYLRQSLAQLREMVNEGTSLAAAMAQHPHLFSPVAVNMVRAGEASGSLETVLTQLADLGERQLAMRRRIQSAMVYPAFMAVVAIGVMVLLMTCIMPNITRVFLEMEQALPLPTRVLMALSGMLGRWWWLVLVGLVLLAMACRQLLGRPAGLRRWHEWKLRLPWWGGVEVRLAASGFARTLGSLLQAGVEMVTALGIVRNLIGNTILAERLDMATTDVERGVGLGQAMRRQRVFPSLLTQMISVGEHSGSLPAMLERAAESYERELEGRLLSLIALIEPVMIVCMGLVVGLIVLAILLPIVEMNQLVR